MPATCSICGDPIGGADPCPPCAGLLRWVRGYYRHAPALAERITPATRFVADLSIESLDWMEWLLEAEDKLDIMIDDHQAGRIETVGEFVRSLKLAGARWPDDRDVEFRRGRWCRPHSWAVVPRRPR